MVPRGGHPSSEGEPNRPDGRRPDSSPKGITVAGQCRIPTGLRSCVLAIEKPPRRPGPVSRAPPTLAVRLLGNPARYLHLPGEIPDYPHLWSRPASRPRRDCFASRGTYQGPGLSGKLESDRLMRIALNAVSDVGTRTGRILGAEPELAALGLYGDQAGLAQDRRTLRISNLEGFDVLVTDDESTASALAGLAVEDGLSCAIPGAIYSAVADQY